MNLGKLLGAGKSFISGHGVSPYRTDKRFYLPQFVSPKNPFTNPAAKPAQTELPKTPTQNLAALAKKISPSPWGKTQKILVFNGQGATARASTWISKLNPISIFNPAPSAADKNVMPVQVELSLERVKVVHNDLTDADVEIVPMKSRPAREPAADMQPAKKSWANLGERIMRATAL
jgi:hypothetical protein